MQWDLLEVERGCSIFGDAVDDERGLHVADSLQGQGIETALLVRIVDWVREHKLPAIYLMVVQDNTRAIRLYEWFGFAASEEKFDEVNQLPNIHKTAR